MALLAGCGASKSSAPAATAATTTAAATSSAATTPGAASVSGCSDYGPTWVRQYNKAAIAQGNPVRMLTACCQLTNKFGVHHCFVTLTLAGTKDLGCESVDIGANGLPAGVGKHEDCAKHD